MHPELVGKLEGSMKDQATTNNRIPLSEIREEEFVNALYCLESNAHGGLDFYESDRYKLIQKCPACGLHFAGATGSQCRSSMKKHLLTKRHARSVAVYESHKEDLTQCGLLDELWRHLKEPKRRFESAYYFYDDHPHSVARRAIIKRWEAARGIDVSSTEQYRPY